MKDELARPIRAVSRGHCLLSPLRLRRDSGFRHRAQAKAIAGYAADQSFAAPTTDSPQDRWWTAYKDPQLDQFIAEALAGSPDLAQAEARVRQAVALAQQVAPPWPSSRSIRVRCGSEAKLQRQHSSIDCHARLARQRCCRLGSQLADRFLGKNHALLAAATSEAEAKRAEASAARIALSTAIAGAYADLASLYADRDAAEDAVRTRSESEALIELRFQQGLENEGRMGSRPRGARAIRGRARRSERSHRYHQERKSRHFLVRVRTAACRSLDPHRLPFTRSAC